MDIVTEKKCSKCGAIKNTKLFYLDNKRKDKLTPQCAECMKHVAQINAPKNKQRKKARAKKLYYENVERSRESARVRTKKYADRNRDKINNKQNEKRAQNIEKFRAYGRENYRKHVDKKKAVHRQWMKNNPGKNREYKANRRARIMNIGGRYTAQEFKELCDKYNNICLCCGKSGKLVADHVIPLVAGGSNDIGNIQPLCFSCNASKYTKTIDYRY